VTSSDFCLPQVVRALGYVAAWARYQATGGRAPSRPPARLTYPGSPSEPARGESDCS
jgi:hypothetical protein